MTTQNSPKMTRINEILAAHCQPFRRLEWINLQTVGGWITGTRGTFQWEREVLNTPEGYTYDPADLDAQAVLHCIPESLHDNEELTELVHELFPAIRNWEFRSVA